MYRKGTAVEIQFSPERLNDVAGDPYWIDLTADEARSLLNTLQTQLERHTGNDAPLVVVLDAARAQTSAAVQTPAPETAGTATGSTFRQWVCVICGWIYDEEAGLPEEGIAPGTRWEDIPADWRCPLCDVGKGEFAMVEF